MSKTILVHGTTVGVTTPFYRRRRTEDGSFEAFRSDLASGQTLLFNWDQDSRDLSLLETINPKTWVDIYLKERDYAKTTMAAEKLSAFVHLHTPSTIIAHSLGSHYLFSTLNTTLLPDSVTRIIFINSEAPAKMEINNPSIKDKINAGTLKVDNYYFWWDPTILSSTLLTGQIASGVIGFESDLINNIHFSPHKHFPFLSDPHTFSIKYPHLYNLIYPSSDKS